MQIDSSLKCPTSVLFKKFIKTVQRLQFKIQSLLRVPVK